MSENQEIKSNDDNQNDETIPSVTMIDILEQQKEQEEELAAVLGGSDEKCCTYSQGYIKRQALYSCLTCCPEAKTDITKSSGICLACSYQCHEYHELIELYTKRNFQCDCPTDRIPGKKCNFTKPSNTTTTPGTSVKNDDDKYVKNNKNDYNQNFTGVYCICHRPYPDPEDPIQDEMIQCIGCEDWYHTRHLDLNTNLIPQSTEYSEMICGQCMEKHYFLKDYIDFAVQKIDNSNNNLNDSAISESDINCSDLDTTTSDDKLKSDLDKSISDIMNITNENTDKEEIKNDKDELEEPNAKKLKVDERIKDESICKKPTPTNKYEKGAIFWPNAWRKELCTCLKCSHIYDDTKSSFLLDPEDTVLFYEENGMKKARESDYERGIRALSTMGHTQQIDAITEYNHMKDKLKEYLHTFVINNKVVTEEDINTFFQGMKNEKNNNSGQKSHFCR